MLAAGTGSGIIGTELAIHGCTVIGWICKTHAILIRGPGFPRTNLTANKPAISKDGEETDAFSCPI